ncbi:hypothetical protein KZ385_09080, partial [Glaesserella parasuis]|nr:hypothetical protein [Glaesserella parasuis]
MKAYLHTIKIRLKTHFITLLHIVPLDYPPLKSISSEETPQAPELVIDDYQQASFVAPQDAVISGSGAALFETTSNIEPASILFFILCKCCFFFFF